jgi:DNA recombination protein RmuC
MIWLDGPLYAPIATSVNARAAPFAPANLLWCDERQAVRMDSLVTLVSVGAVLAGLLLAVFAVLRVEGSLRRAEADRAAREGGEAALLESKLRDLAAAQSEIAGRFSQAIESQSQAQSDLQRAVAERLEALDRRLGENLKETATKTAETLGGLQTRLAVIDEAQKNLAGLSGQVVGLQQILANKQARGAYGQGQMEAIIRDALPKGAYEFQAQLSNRNKPDCIVRIPGATTLMVIDSKFPLESFEALRAAANEAEKRVAEQRIRSDVGKHVKDIAERYLIQGETQTPALMFVPSESLYAELHDSFPDVIQKALRAQVIVVSPNILLLAINTMLTIMKDARMREQASLIQKEVGYLLNDVRLLTDRVRKLETHLGQAEGDIKDILTSSGKITGRAERIAKVELSPAETALASPTTSGRAEQSRVASFP